MAGRLKIISLERDVRNDMMKLSVSMALIWLIQQLYSAADMIIVGQVIGAEATAAVATAGDFTNVTAMIATAIASGAAVYISQLEGAKDLENLRQAIGSAIVLLFIVAAGALGYAFLFEERYLDHMNCPPEAIESARSYLLITAAGLPFVFTYTGIISILKAMGYGRNPLLFALLACVLNVVGDVVLVIGFHMGVVGSAVATTLSQLICCVLSLINLAKTPSLFEKRSLRFFLLIERKTFRRIMRMAIPQVIRIFLVQCSFLWLRGEVNEYGLVDATSYSIWFKLERFSNFLVFGVQEASCNIIGQQIGAKKYDQVKLVVWLTMLLGLAGTVLPMILFLGVPRSVFRIFTNETEVIARAPELLSILTVGLFVNAFGNGSKGISVGAGNSLLSLFVGILDAGARFAISLLFVRMLHFGVAGYYWGMALAPFAPGVLCIVYLLSERWKYRKRLSET